MRKLVLVISEKSTRFKKEVKVGQRVREKPAEKYVKGIQKEIKINNKKKKNYIK